ncbi:MAG: hypothetical protein IKE43_07155 [Coriobacteriales bacterium]|nr:hypothetical protein [Coriobacteriales bacterium]
MNRFEALNTLGLEEEASEEEIKLAYYGIDKEINPLDYAQNTTIQNQVKVFLDKAKEARDFLLNARNSSAARQVLNYKGKKQRQDKLTVTAKEAKKARLSALEKVWTIVAQFLDQQRTRRNTCIGLLIGSAVVGFFVLRYIRLMPPRIILFIILAIIVVISSTILTTSIKQIIESRKIMVSLEEKMEPLKEVKPALMPGEENTENKKQSSEAESDAQNTQEDSSTEEDVDHE